MRLAPCSAHRSGKEACSHRQQSHRSLLQFFGDDAAGDEPQGIGPPADRSTDGERNGLHRRSQIGQSERGQIIVNGTSDDRRDGGQDERRARQRLGRRKVEKWVIVPCGQHDILFIEVIEAQSGHLPRLRQPTDHQVDTAFPQLAHQVEMRASLHRQHHLRPYLAEAERDAGKEPACHRRKDTDPQRAPRAWPKGRGACLQ